MKSKIRSFKFLSNIFTYLTNDLIYLISRFVGKYIHEVDVGDKIYKTKNKKDKYLLKHYVNVRLKY